MIPRAGVYLNFEAFFFFYLKTDEQGNEVASRCEASSHDRGLAVYIITCVTTGALIKSARGVKEAHLFLNEKGSKNVKEPE